MGQAQGFFQGMNTGLPFQINGQTGVPGNLMSSPNQFGGPINISKGINPTNLFSPVNSRTSSTLPQQNQSRYKNI